MTKKRSRSSCWRAVRQLFLVGSAVLLSSCTVAVSQLAPNPPDGEYLSLVLEVMAESANRAQAPDDSQRAGRAVNAVAVWRGSGESGGEPSGPLPSPQTP